MNTKRRLEGMSAFPTKYSYFAALRKEKREKLVSSKRIRYDESESEDKEITVEQVLL